MAGTEVSEKPTFKLKLLVDKEKYKVVLAEAGKDFVDVLFSFLALPMGTIVRFLEKYKQTQKSIGCFNNLYKSVSDLCIDYFMTEACKDMILYPEKQCRRLNLSNIDDDTECHEIFNLHIDDDTEKSFIVTEDMKVKFASFDIILKTLRGLGYKNSYKLEEMFVHVDHKEVLSLLCCLFSSETPLTDAFLKKQSSCGMTRSPDMANLDMRDKSKPLSLTLLVRKQDKKVLYAESRHGFVDLLFIFLAVPLESVWEITGRNIEVGCIDNFCRSMKSLSSSGGTNASSYACMLPLEYSFQKSLLGERDVWGHLIYDGDDGSYDSTLDSSSGFVKQWARYMISDDLTITAANSSSLTSIVMNLNVDFDDIESHVIEINKTQAIGLLRASLMTSTALNTALGGLISKKQEE